MIINNTSDAQAYVNLLQGIANGKTIQGLSNTTGLWEDLDTPILFEGVHTNYRIKTVFWYRLALMKDPDTTGDYFLHAMDSNNSGDAQERVELYDGFVKWLTPITYVDL